jgi:hypothetical protein
MYESWMIDGDDSGSTVGTDDWQGKTKYSEKPCPVAALTPQVPEIT